MGLTLGDEVELSGEGSATFRIVGEVLFPQGDFEHDSGVVITADGAGPLGGIEAAELHQIALSWEPGVDAAAADQSLRDHGYQVFATREGLVPPVVSNLGDVEGLPVLLAGLVLVLALVTAFQGVSHSTRLRQREAGTLQALGMTPRAIGTMVGAHTAVVLLVAVAIGIPLGLAAGRQVWQQIASRAHVIDHPVPAWIGMAWMVALFFLGTAILTLAPALRTLRQRPAEALRSE
jgi:ABC-type antimicrobial peptide transport system permease subunit